MSVRVMHEVFSCSRATRGSRLVLIAIADNASDDGVAWPGQDELAGKTLLDKDSVNKAVPRLVELGELEVRKARRGRSFINVYRVVVGRVGLAPVDYERLPFELSQPFSQHGETSDSNGKVQHGDSPSFTPTIDDIQPGDFRRSVRRSSSVQHGVSSAPTRARGSVEPSQEPPAQPSSESSLEPSSAAAAANYRDLARRLNSETLAAQLAHELDAIRPPARVRIAALEDPERALAWIETAKTEAHTNPGHFFIRGIDSGEWPSLRGTDWRDASKRRDWAVKTAPLLDQEHVEHILEEWAEAGRIDQIEANDLRELASTQRKRRTQPAAEAAA